ncbi:MAG: hypothetical protein QW493_03665 [Candidatus Bathyarchaeia archaeon]
MNILESQTFKTSGGKPLKKKPLVFTVCVAVYLILTLNMLLVKNVQAGNAYTVEWINHTVEVLSNGYILINDTIKVGGTPPANFLMGFPYRYGAYVLECSAFPTASLTRRYNVTVGVPLEGRIGFYGVSIALNPPPDDGVFSVYFILSQSLLRQSAANTSLFTLDFPAYPSLTVKASSCNASLVLPSNARYISGTVPSFNYSTGGELQAFHYEEANVIFALTTKEIQLYTVEEFKREISISALGEITVSDSYYIKNQSPAEISSIQVVLLPNASDITVEDEFGRKGERPNVIDTKTNCYDVALTFAGRTLSLKSGESARFIVKYKLPSSFLSKGEQGSELTHLQMFRNIKYYIKDAWITLTFPEGAKVVNLNCTSSSTDITHGVVTEIFQERVILRKQGALLLNDLTVGVSYAYNLLWLSFRPTLWAWAIATFACAVIASWKKVKAPAKAVVVAAPTVAVKVTSEILTSFIKSYEERRKVLAEIKSLEVAVSKGRIPRQRYKVQRRTLEVRLATIDRNLNELKWKLRAAGGRYADLMRQLEVAETEINEVEEDIRSIESRHRRGEITLEAYRRLLADYQRRKEKAETTIDGILLRLREEIR